MIHFVRQLQYFCHLEVIDCSWSVLEEFAQKKEGDLDTLINAHQAYVERLASKALLKGNGAKQVSRVDLSTSCHFKKTISNGIGRYHTQAGSRDVQNHLAIQRNSRWVLQLCFS